MAFKPSTHQVNFYNHLSGTRFNIVLDAKAGSGKTTTIVSSISMIPDTLEALFLAFNVHITKTLKEKITRPKTVISTIHGMGSRLLSKTFKSNKDDSKYRNIAKILSANWEVEEDKKAEYIGRILKLCELMRLSMCDTITDGEELAIRHGIDAYGKEIEHAVQLIQAGRKIVNIIDYTDMLYLPNYYNLKPWQYDIVYVDEAQDMSKASRLLMLRHVKPNGRFVAVGDPNQAIYSFAGADSQSFQSLCSLPNTKVLPLSVCYRCCKAVIREAQNIVPEIEAAENAIEGTVVHDGKIANVVDGDFILCRTTMPLVKLCMGYLKQGRKAFIKGKDIGANIIRFIEKSKLVYTKDLHAYFITERHTLITKVCYKYKMDAIEASDHPDVMAFDEKVQIVGLLSAGLQECSMVADKIHQIFNDESTDGITLSTVHKAKGLEANRVHIVQPELLPAPWAKKPDDIAQEMNLRYVAITRAAEYLSFVLDFDAYEKKKENDKKKKGHPEKVEEQHGNTETPAMF